MTAKRLDAGLWRRRAAVVCLLLFALSLWAPPAFTSTAPDKAEVKTALEAWYYVADDAEEPPAPLPLAPEPVNPYGDHTLHVGITAGQEDTRTYLTLDVEDLPVTFKVVDGRLTLPIAPDNGTINAETSRVQICLAMPPAKADEGSFEEPPEVDCKTHSPAPYRAKPFPHLIADLTPFGEDLAFSALAVVPSERAVAKQDTWHVAFYAKRNETKGAKDISATLSYVEETFAAPTVETPTVDSAPPSSGGGFDVGEVGGFDTSAPSSGIDNGSVTDAPDAGEPAAPVAAQPVAQPLAATHPGYNIVWSVPLILLALYFYFGSALTREIVVRWDR